MTEVFVTAYDHPEDEAVAAIMDTVNTPQLPSFFQRNATVDFIVKNILAGYKIKIKGRQV